MLDVATPLLELLKDTETSPCHPGDILDVLGPPDNFKN